MKERKLLALFLALTMVMPTVGVSAEEIEPTTIPTEISAEETQAEEPVLDGFVIEEPVIDETVIDEDVSNEDVSDEKESDEKEPDEEESDELTLMENEEEEEDALEPMATGFTRLDLCEFLLDQAGIEPFDYFSNSNRYTDVTESNSYYELVRTCAELGWLDGLNSVKDSSTGARLFSPDRAVTRWELACVLYQANQGSTSITARPSDMSADNWGCYYDVCYVVSSGVMSLSSGKFYPNNEAKLSDINVSKWKNSTPFTRGSFCAFLVDELDLSCENTDWPENPYRDLSKSNKYYNDIMTCYYMGLLNNAFDSSNLRENRMVRREEAATILFNANQGGNTLAAVPNDMNSDDYYAAEIRSILGAGIMSVDLNKYFNDYDATYVSAIDTSKLKDLTENPLTWGELAELLVTENGVSDVDYSDERNNSDYLSSSDPYYDDIMICQALDWMYTNNDIWPYEAVNREDLAKLLYDAGQYGTPVSELPADILDRYGSSSSWVDYFAGVLGSGIMSVRPTGDFHCESPAYPSDINLDALVPSGIPLTLGILCELLVDKLGVSIPEECSPANPFDKISTSDPYYEDILTAYYLGWLDARFSPYSMTSGDEVSFDELALVLYSAGQFADGSIAPSNYSASNSYYSEICGVLNAGVLSLPPDGKFPYNQAFVRDINLSKLKTPEKALTNGEFMNFFVEVMGAENTAYSNVSSTQFEYIDKDSPYFKAAAICYKLWGWNSSLMNEDPYKVVTRETVASYLANANQGTDIITVKAKDYNNTTTNKILSAGILSIDKYGHFNPDAPAYLSDINVDAINPSGFKLSRASICTLLVEALDVSDIDTAGITMPYTDVSKKDSYYNDVLIAYNLGWLKSWDIYSNKLRPAEMIDGEELLEILCRAGQGGEPTDNPPTNINPSSDNYYMASILLGSGVISLDENGQFDVYGDVYPSRINMNALKPYTISDGSISAETLDLADGTIVIETSYEGITYNQSGVKFKNDKGAIIKQSDPGTPTNNTIIIKNKDSFGKTPVKLTLVGLNIFSQTTPIQLQPFTDLSNVNTVVQTTPLQLQSFLDVELNLEGENTLESSSVSAINVARGTALTIGGNGKLSAINTSSRDRYAAIGTYENTQGGSITINSGTVYADGYYNGIGGKQSLITINGGTVTGNGPGNFGIGGEDSSIIINGGTVTAANSKYSGFGIGGKHSYIDINGGIVDATGSATGIGGNYSLIDINSSTVTATTPNSRYPAIGGINSTVSISNADVTLNPYYYGIGGGYGTNNADACEAITVKDSSLTFNFKNTSTYDQNYEYIEKITINKHPAAATALNSGLVFSVDAYGNSGLSYQWESSTDNSTWTAMEGKTEATLSTPLAEGTYYRCKLTNGWGNTLYTNSVQGFKLGFKQQPTDITSAPDGLVGLYVTAENPNVTYQWQKSLNGHDWQNLEGETASSIALDITIHDNGAYYRCVIRATNGETLPSDPALISISTDAPTYRTEYYLEQTDGTYLLMDQAVAEAAYGDTVTAVEKEFEYYEENTEKGTLSGKVTTGAQLVLSRYYDLAEYTIILHENGGADLADISAKYGAPVSAPANPSRYGYVFSGWFSDDTLITPYTFTTMPGGGISVYAKWDIVGAGRDIEYSFNSISVFDSKTHQKLSYIPKDEFELEVSVENLSSKTTDTMVVATYDENGQMLGIFYMYSNTAEGNTSVLGTTINNSDGSIASVKAFMVPFLNSQTPLAKSISFGR